MDFPLTYSGEISSTIEGVASILYGAIVAIDGQDERSQISANLGEQLARALFARGLHKWELAAFVLAMKTSLDAHDRYQALLRGEHHD